MWKTFLWIATLWCVGSRLAAQPSNDQFHNATPLESISTKIEGTLEGASVEVGEPVIPGTGPFVSAWWSWAPATNVTVAFFAMNHDDSRFDEYARRIEVYRGTNVSALQLLGRQSDYNRPLVFTALAGQKYLIRLSGVLDAARPYALYIATIPANDQFAKRRRIDGVFHREEIFNSLATREIGERLVDPTALGKTVWFQWKAPADGQLLLTGEALQWAPVLGLATGSTLETLNYSAQAEPDVLEVGYFARRFAVKAGVEYSVVVDGSRYSTGFGNAVLDYHGLCTLTLSFSSLRIANLTKNIRIREATPFSVKLESAVPALEGPFSQMTLHLRRLAWTQEFDYPMSVPALEAEVPGLSPGLFVVYADGFNASGIYHETPLVQFQVYPASDAFSDRAEFDAYAGGIATSVSQASLEAGEAAIWPIGTIGSAWWSFVAPTTGTYQLDAGLLTAVFTGSTLSQLKREAGPTTQPISFLGVAGQTYHIGVATTGADSNPVAAFDLFPPLLNDSIADGLELPASKGVISFWAHNRNSTREPGEPVHLESGELGSIWWLFTPSANGVLSLRASRRDGGSLGLAIYQGDRLAGLGAPVGKSMPPQTELYVHLTQGVTYSLVIVRPNSLQPEGLFRVTGEFVPKAMNDRFDQRTMLSGVDLGFSARVFGATLEPGEIDLGEGSVWWRWDAPESGILRVSSSQTGYIHIYEGGTIAELAEIKALGGSSGGQPWKEVFVSGGQQVAIRFGHPPSDRLEIPMQLRFTPTPPAPNDHFASRTLLSGRNVRLSLAAQSVSGETGEPDFASAVGGAPGGSRWFEWSVPESGRTRFSVTPPSLLRLYRNSTQRPEISGLMAASDFSSVLIGDVQAGDRLFIGIYSPYPAATELFTEAVAVPANEDVQFPELLTNAPPFKLISSVVAKPVGTPTGMFWGVAVSATWHLWIPDAYGDVSTAGSSDMVVFLGKPSTSPVDGGNRLRFTVAPGQAVWLKLIGGLGIGPGSVDLNFAPVAVQTGIRKLSADRIELGALGPAGRWLKVDSSVNLNSWFDLGALPLNGQQFSRLTNVSVAPARYYRFRLLP